MCFGHWRLTWYLLMINNQVLIGIYWLRGNMVMVVLMVPHIFLAGEVHFLAGEVHHFLVGDLHIRHRVYEHDPTFNYNMAA